MTIGARRGRGRSGGAGRRAVGSWLALLAAVAVLANPAAAGDFAVVINEIHYHPADDARDGEFVEIVNAGGEPVDLDGWRFADGIDFVFPEDASIAPGAFLVIARDAALIRDRYGIAEDLILGDWKGSLDNAGERVALVNAVGTLISAVAYGDERPWASTPDGLGPSLERVSPWREEDDPAAWEPSIVVGGTPGRRNSAYRESGPGAIVDLVPAGATWRYFKGRREPSGGSTQWTRFGFNDLAWAEGEAGFGYGDGDDATVLGDMERNYVSVYVRHTFTVADPSLYQSLILYMNYDDGFVAYLNGREIARAHVDGNPPAYDIRAESHEAEGFEPFPIAGGAGLLVEGFNVLAVQGHNRSSRSSDFSLHPALGATRKPGEPPPERPSRDHVINEVAPGEAADGWVELYNRGDAPVSLDGFVLELFPPSAGSAPLPAGFLEPGAFLVIDEAALPFALDSVLPNLILAASDGLWKDGFNPRTVAAGRSTGLYPDGVDDRYVFLQPTPGTPNRIDPDERVVITEIQYHPATPGTQYIEIFNRSAEEVTLTGWAFTRGLSYAFEDGQTIASGAYLVIAEDPGAVEAHYGITGVLGPWTGGLRNDAETVILRDDLHNVVDIVRFADDGSWPPEPDGTGPSLELVHPDAENRYGPAWAASTGDGTPGAANSASAAAVRPIVADVDHAPAVPGPGDPVLVTARVSALAGLDFVQVRWRRDGSTGASSSMPMQDDGTGGDVHAGDGVYSALLPAATDRRIRTFWIRARDLSGAETIAPTSAPGRTFLYQVDATPPQVERPLYRVIMKEANRQRLATRDIWSDTLLDATFVDGEHVYYNVGIRLRGRSARRRARKSYRIQFRHDRPLHGIKRLNLNACHIEKQRVGLEFLARAGIPSPLSWFRELAMNGEPQGLYLRVEAVDNAFLERQFPLDDEGNLYRGEDHADLDYRGRDPDRYRDNYLKKNHEEEDDFGDIFDLCDRFDRSSDAAFPSRIEGIIDADQWAQYFAAFAILGSTEGSILLDRGDDYFLYHRPSDGRFILLPWDLDSVYNEEDQRLFRPTVDAIERFLRHPFYAPRYFCWIETYLDGAFAPEVALGRIDAMAGLFAGSLLQDLKAYVPARRSFLEARMRREIAVDVRGGTSVCGSDRILVTGSRVSLTGTAPGCGTSAVEVAGELVPFDPVTGQWSATASLDPGPNEVAIRCLDREGGEAAVRILEIDRVGTLATLSGTIASDRVLDAAGGPYTVSGTVRVASGVTLTVGPGAELFFRTDGALAVDGRFRIEGTEADRVVLGPAACDGRWLGIDLHGTADSIAYCDLTGATSSPDGPAAITVHGGALTVRESTLTHIDKGIDVQDGGSLLVEDCLAEDTEETFHANASHITLRRVIVRRVRGYNDAVDTDGDGPVPCLIEDCEFAFGDDDGIDTLRTTMTIRRTIVHDMADKGLSLEGSSDVTVDRALIYRCGEAAIAMKDSVRVAVDHATLYASAYGLHLFEKNAGRGVGHGVVENSIVWDNGEEISLEAGGSLAISYSDVKGAAPPPGPGNLAADPQFLDLAADDFHLAASSPCRGAAGDGTDMGFYPGSAPPQSRFIRADSNDDGQIDLGDAVSVLSTLFSGTPTDCEDAQDANDDGQRDIADAIYILSYLFSDGPAPPPPFESAGEDPTPDDLGCARRAP